MNAKDDRSEPESVWQYTPYTNLVRYKPSEVYFARFRVKGKLIRRSLKTNHISVAKLRLADLEKVEQQKAQSVNAVASGKMTFGDSLALFQTRLQANPAIKPRTKEYCAYRVSALLKAMTYQLCAFGNARNPLTAPQNFWASNGSTTRILDAPS